MGSWDFLNEPAGGYSAPSSLADQSNPFDAIISKYSSGQTPRYSPTSRGFFGDFASNLARGGVNLAGMAGYMLDDFEVGNTLSSWAESAPERWEFLRPDMEEYVGEGWWSTSWKGALQAAPLSAAPFAAGIAGTAAAGPVGGIAAGVSTLFGLFGYGTYNQKYKELVDDGMSPERAKTVAMQSAALEVGTEGLSDLVAVGTAGLLAAPAKAASGGLKALLSKGAVEQSLEGVLKLGAKNVRNSTLATVGAEVGTEALNEYLQTTAERYARAQEGMDLGELTPTQAAWQAVGPALFLAGGITVGTQGVGRARRKAIVNTLNDPEADRAQKQVLVEAIADGLQSRDPEVADAWRTVSTHILQNNGTFNIQENFVEQASSIIGEEIGQAREARGVEQAKSAEQIIQEALKEQPGMAEEARKLRDQKLDELFGIEAIQEQMADTSVPQLPLLGDSPLLAELRAIYPEAHERPKTGEQPPPSGIPSLREQAVGLRTDTAIRETAEAKAERAEIEATAEAQRLFDEEFQRGWTQKATEANNERSRSEYYRHMLAQAETRKEKAAAARIAKQTQEKLEYVGVPAEAKVSPELYSAIEQTPMEELESRGIDAVIERMDAAQSETVTESQTDLGGGPQESQRVLNPARKTRLAEAAAEYDKLSGQLQQYYDEQNTEVKSPEQQREAAETQRQMNKLEDEITELSEMTDENLDEIYPGLTDMYEMGEAYSEPASTELEEAVDAQIEEIQADTGRNEIERAAESNILEGLVTADMTMVDEALEEYTTDSQKAALVNAVERLSQAIEQAEDTPGNRAVKQRAYEVMGELAAKAEVSKGDIPQGFVKWKKAASNLFTATDAETGQNYFLIRQPIKKGDRKGRWRIAVTRPDGVETTLDTSRKDESVNAFVRRFYKSEGPFVKEKLEDISESENAYTTSSATQTGWVSREGKYVLVPRWKGGTWGVLEKGVFDTYGTLDQKEKRAAFATNSDGKASMTLDEAKALALQLEGKEVEAPVKEGITAESALLTEAKESARQAEAGTIAAARVTKGKRTGKPRGSLEKELLDLEAENQSGEVIIRRGVKKLKGGTETTVKGDKYITKTMLYRGEFNRSKSAKALVLELEGIAAEVTESLMQTRIDKLAGKKAKTGDVRAIAGLREAVFELFGYKNSSDAPAEFQTKVDAFLLNTAANIYQTNRDAAKNLQKDIAYHKDQYSLVGDVWSESKKRQYRRDQEKRRKLIKERQEDADHIATEVSKLRNQSQQATKNILGTINFKKPPLLSEIDTNLNWEGAVPKGAFPGVDLAEVQQSVPAFDTALKGVPVKSPTVDPDTLDFTKGTGKEKAGTVYSLPADYTARRTPAGTWQLINPKGTVLKREFPDQAAVLKHVKKNVVPNETQPLADATAETPGQEKARKWAEDVRASIKARGWSFDVARMERYGQSVPDAIFSNNGKFSAHLSINPDKSLFAPRHQWVVRSLDADGGSKGAVAYYENMGQLLKDISGDTKTGYLGKKAKATKSMFSLGDGTQVEGLTPDQVRTELVSALGERSAQQWDGSVVIVESIEDVAPVGVELRDRQMDGPPLGYYNPATKTITLVANNIGAGRVQDVFLHEGVHHVMDNDPMYRRVKDPLLAQVTKLKDKPGAVQDAWAEAQEKNPDATESQIAEEAYAYLVQNPENRQLSIVRRAIAAVKQFLIRMRVPVGALGLTEGDLVAMATRSILDAKNLTPVQQQVVDTSNLRFAVETVEGTQDALETDTPVRDDVKREKIFKPTSNTTPKNEKGKYRSDYVVRKGDEYLLYQDYDPQTKEYRVNGRALDQAGYENLAEEWSAEQQQKDMAYASGNPVELNAKESWKQTLLKKGKEVKDLGKGLTQVISEGVRNIAPKAYASLNKMEFLIQDKQRQRLTKAKAWANKYHNSLTAEERFALDKALRNGDVRTRDRILQKGRAVAEWEEVQGVLDEMRGEAQAVGLLPEDGLIENYFPRVIKPGEVDNLIASLEDADPTEFSVISNELARLKESIEARGGVFQQGDKIAHIQKVLNTGNYQFIPKPGSAKDRGLAIVEAKHSQFYENSADAIARHIFDLTQGIEYRAMLGKQNLTRPKEMARLTRVVKAIDTLDRMEKRTESQEQELTKLWEDWKTISENLQSIDSDLENSISAYVAELVDKGDVRGRELVNLIRSRLTQRGTHGLVGNVRDVGYMMALGSPMSALTQIGDIAWSLYANGVINTATTVFKAIPTMFGSSPRLTKDFFDFSQSLGDFSKTGIENLGTQRALDKILTYSGLKGMDLFGKEVLMQGAANRLGDKKKRDALIEEKAYLFDGDKKRTKKALEAMEKKDFGNDDVRFLLFNELSQWQPISLSEMPAIYNTAGNARIFYMLKSFNIKALNNMHREIVGNWESGKKMQAAKNGVYLLTALSMMGAGSDELKDFIQGKDAGTFGDNVHDNLIKLFMMNRFSIETGLAQGQFVSTLVKDQIPPVRYLDYFIDDAVKFGFDRENFKFRSLQNIPVLGRIGYSQGVAGAAGQEQDLKRIKTDLYEQIRKNAAAGESLYSGGVRAQVEVYNRKAAALGEERLQYKTLKNVRKKELKKLREAA